jgi:hypothetical protein
MAFLGKIFINLAEGFNDFPLLTAIDMPVDTFKSRLRDSTFEYQAEDIGLTLARDGHKIGRDLGKVLKKVYEVK